jgi:hypothetical protein
MDYLACKTSFVRNASVVLTYRCVADVPVCSLNIASVVDYAEMNYRDFPQLMQIDLNSEQTKTFPFHSVTDVVFIIILQGYNL